VLLADRLLDVGEVTAVDWDGVHVARHRRVNTGEWARRALGVAAALLGLLLSLCIAWVSSERGAVPGIGYLPMVLGLIALHILTPGCTQAPAWPNVSTYATPSRPGP
jgi:hypothetical protein